MKELINSRGAKRLGAAGLGGAVANFLFALLVFQFGVDIHPNVVASGTVLISLLVNIGVSKYLKE